MSDIQHAPIHVSQDGDHDKFAHYAEKDEIMKAFVHGVSIVALCGKVWVPTRDGEKFPVCPECDKIYSQLL